MDPLHTSLGRQIPILRSCLRKPLPSRISSAYLSVVGKRLAPVEIRLYFSTIMLFAACSDHSEGLGSVVVFATSVFALWVGVGNGATAIVIVQSGIFANASRQLVKYAGPAHGHLGHY